MKVERYTFKKLETGGLPPPAAGVKNKIFIPANEKGRNAEPPPPPPPVYSEADLKTAEREGYKKGFAAGMQDGRKQAESEQSATALRVDGMAEAFVQSVAPLVAHYRKTAAEIKRDTPRLALAVARKVAAEALENNADAVVAAISERCCEIMLGEPKITITVHEGNADALEKRLHALAARLPESTDIVIARDPALPASDCRIEWKHGAMERNTAHLWADIEKAIETISAAAAGDAEAQMDVLQAQLPGDAPASTRT